MRPFRGRFIWLQFSVFKAGDGRGFPDHAFGMAFSGGISVYDIVHSPQDIKDQL
jgi:hypothetical protein